VKKKRSKHRTTTRKPVDTKELLEELTFMMDTALLENQIRLAFKCAMAIDRIKGRYS
jgi:hypothetical protein